MDLKLSNNSKKVIDDYIMKVDGNVIYVDMLVHETYKPKKRKPRLSVVKKEPKTIITEE